MAFQKMSPEELRKHKGISFPGVSTVFICHDGEGNILLGRRSQKARDEQGRWDVGGGGLKHGQSLEQNLIREVKEEYDAIPKKVEFIGYMDAFRQTPDGMPTHWLAMYFSVLVDPELVKINEPDMTDEIGWFQLDRLPAPIHSQFNKFYKLHGAKLRRHLGVR